MATLRDLRNKIRSINNTKKITRTMEMIATAKSVVCQKRIEAVQPYGDKLAELLTDLGGVRGNYPLLRQPDKIGKEAVFVITANRGLCGGYNSNTLKLAEQYLDRRKSEGVETEVHMIGKKGIARFKYSRRDVTERYTQFDDRPSFDAAEQVIGPAIERFASGDLDAVTLVFTHYENATRQEPVVRPILPIGPDGKDGGGGQGSSGSVDFIFEPSPEVILGTLLPLSLKMQFFQALVEAATSEQIARRIAMKNATDNAEEMGRTCNMAYNRQRQAGITQEILEVIGGAAT